MKNDKKTSPSAAIKLLNQNHQLEVDMNGITSPIERMEGEYYDPNDYVTT